MSDPPNKHTLRKHFIKLRKEISSKDRQQAHLAVVSLFTNHVFFKQSTHIACYLAVKDEFDSQAIIQAIWKAKKKCYLPVLDKNKNEKSMVFVHYEENSLLQPNHVGIPEPVDQSTFLPANTLDLIIMPLVAFDLRGNRLGTGGGYYDRTLVSFLNQPHTKPLLMGLGYDIQQHHTLPMDEWDVPLDGVMTEKRMVIFNP